MAACNGGKGKTDNKTEKQTESIKSTERVQELIELDTEVTTEAVAEMSIEELTDAQSDAEEPVIDDIQSVYTQGNLNIEEQQNSDVKPEPNVQTDDNKEHEDISGDTGNDSPSIDTPRKDSDNSQPEYVPYSPYNVVALVTAKCQVGGMITTQQNLDNLLAKGKITQEEYKEYYPYDGMEESYYSVFVETDLNKASTISGQKLSSEDEIAEYISGMLLLERDPVFYVSYDGICTTGGTQFYEFRCHR